MREYYESPRWMYKYQNCSLPVVLDTYSKCSYGCLYCLSRFQRALTRCYDNRTFYEKDVKQFNVNFIKGLFKGENKLNGIESWLHAKKAVQWGGLSDPFDENERKLGASLQLLEFLSEIRYPLSISTKGTWVFDDERYLNAFKAYGDRLHIKFSIITTDERAASRIECGVPSPAERLRAMAIASKLGVHTTLRLRPFIVGLSDLCMPDLVTAAAKAGAYSLSTEFLCIDRRMPRSVRRLFDALSKVLGYDIVDFYIKNSRSDTYMRLNSEIKAPIFYKLKSLCDRAGLKFYNSDLDFRELAETCCCCGAPDCFNYSTGTLVQALKLAQKNGSVHFSQIYEDLSLLRGSSLITCINPNTAVRKRKFANFSLFDYVRYLWNTPDETHSPKNEFRDTLLPGERDRSGDLVYYFNKKII